MYTLKIKNWKQFFIHYYHLRFVFRYMFTFISYYSDNEHSASDVFQKRFLKIISNWISADMANMESGLGTLFHTYL